jgi:small subunit ribosomal protein S18
MLENDTPPRDLNPSDSYSSDRSGSRGGYRSFGDYGMTRHREGGTNVPDNERSQDSSGEFYPRRGESDRRDSRGERGRSIKKQQVFKKRTCPFCLPGSVEIDYKDVDTLSKFLSDRGKILPSRVTSVCLKDQRDLSIAIKRARFLALLPYVND